MKFKILSTSLIVFLSFSFSQASYGMEKDQRSQFAKLPKVLQNYILQFDEYNRGKANKRFGSTNKIVCKDWRNLYNHDAKNGDAIKKAWHEGRLVHLETKYIITDLFEKEVLKRVYNNGTLTYRPNLESDEGKIDLLVSKLKHPLEGTFKIPEYREYLSINMGCPKGKKQKNADETEIADEIEWEAKDPQDIYKIKTCVRLRFLIKEEPRTPVVDFKRANWKEEQAPVGMFWTPEGEGYDLCSSDYFISKSIEKLGESNIYENWNNRTKKVRWVYHHTQILAISKTHKAMEHFTFHF